MTGLATPLAFIGDSLTYDWLGTGRATWDEYFAPLRAYNFGVPGDTAGDVLRRIRNGELDAAAPASIVLLVGTNDLGCGTSPDAVGDAVVACARALLERYPAATLVLLGLLPRRADERTDPRTHIVNAALGRLARRPEFARMTFENISGHFVDARGGLRTGYYDDDGLHLAAPGYRAWGNAMRDLGASGVSGNIRIDPIAPADHPAWYAMYVAYARAVDSPVDETVATTVWSWLCAGTHGMRAVLGRVDGVATGFAHYRAFPRTLDGNEAGYLDDLFVVPEYRSTGVARALIAYVCDDARARGWTELRWVTTPQNRGARRLYDDLAEASELITYRRYL